jgi:hypothetical protein
MSSRSTARPTTHSRVTKPSGNKHVRGRRRKHSGHEGLEPMPLVVDGTPATGPAPAHGDESSAAMSAVITDPVLAAPHGSDLDMVEELLPTLPIEWLSDLRQMLEVTLVQPDAHEVRHDQLGLLVQLLIHSLGTSPRTKDYDAEVERRRAIGEEWPSSTKLEQDLGRWDKAVAVASKLVSKGAAAGIRAINRRDKTGGPERTTNTYSAREVVAAIHWCRDVLDRWPNRREFVAFGRLERELARSFHRPRPRIPAQEAWQHAYGKWDACLKLAISVARG